MEFSMLRIFYVSVTSVCLVPLANASNPWSIGMGSAVELSPYKGVDAKLIPVVPIINYENSAFFVHATTAGLYLWHNSTDTLTLNVNYSPLHFKPSDSDNHQLQSLDKRRSTMMTGMTYRHKAIWGTVRTNISVDVLNERHGMTAEGAYLYTLSMRMLTLTPGIGINWQNETFNDYYYGISSHESQRSGLAQYDAGKSISPFVELTANYHINSNWNTFVIGRYTQMDDNIKNSPMVDKSYNALIFTGITYAF